MTIKNARIKSTTLGYEDHGILTFWLNLDYGGGGQGFGGYGLDDYDEARKQRVGTAFGLEAIAGVLKTLNVSKWEDLPGTPLRVDADMSHVTAIGHLLEEKWLNLKTLAKEHEDCQGESLK